MRRQNHRVFGKLEDGLALLVACIQLAQFHGESVACIAREQPQVVGLADQHGGKGGAVRRIDGARHRLPLTPPPPHLVPIPASTPPPRINPHALLPPPPPS